MTRPTSQTPIYDSSARPSPFVEEFVALLRYRELIFQMVARSVKTRYKRSFLGVAWTMVNPLLTMLVLTVVFSHIFRFPSRNYALYVLSGLLFWNFFAQSTTAAMGDLVWSGGLLGRIFVPKSVFAISAVGTGLVNLALAFIPYTIIALLLGGTFSPAILFLPLVVLITSLFALGVALVISTAAVFFPDVMPMYEVLLTAWLYLTPVIYPADLLPEPIRGILRFNPLYPMVQAFRASLYEGRPPEASTLAAGFLTGIATLIFGWWLFTRKARDVAYYV